MSLYLIEYAESTFVVIADSQEEAKSIVQQDYFGEEDIDLEVSEARDLSKGIIVHYDSEDLYFN